jgi:hypothetical protein
MYEQAKFYKDTYKMCVPGNVKCFGKGDFRTDRMDPHLYSDSLYSEAHTIILHMGENVITSTSRNIYIYSMEFKLC